MYRDVVALAQQVEATLPGLTDNCQLAISVGRKLPTKRGEPLTEWADRVCRSGFLPYNAVAKVRLVCEIIEDMLADARPPKKMHICRKCGAEVWIPIGARSAGHTLDDNRWCPGKLRVAREAEVNSRIAQTVLD